MKAFRSTALFLCLALMGGLFFGCGAKVEPAPTFSPSESATTDEKTAVSVATLAGPTGMGMAYLMEQSEQDGAKNDYSFTVATAADQIVSKLTSGEVDIAAVPTNLAATLYNKTKGDVQLLAINTMSMLYVVQKVEGEEQGVLSISELEGKTIAASGQGAVPEYVLNYILEANGLTGKVTVNYLSEHSEVVTALATGSADIALLPEPFVTVAQNKVEGLVIVLNINSEWEEACDIMGDSASIAMGCVVVRKEFAEENPAAVSLFLEEYFESVEYVNNNAQAAAKLIVKFGILADEAVAAKAIPSSSIVFIKGSILKTTLQGFYEILFESNPASIGGSVPGDDFYYVE